MTPTRAENGVRYVITARTVLQIIGALSAVLASELTAPSAGGSVLRGLLLASALLVLPLDLLPVIMIVSIRNAESVLGPLNPGDLVGLVYLARLMACLGFLRLRMTPSRVMLLLFLLWATVATTMGFGLYTALSRIALYAAVGVAVTYRSQAKSTVFVGIVVFAVVEVICYLPQFPGRMWGILVNDPAHMGGLLIAALIVISTSPLPRALKVSLAVVLLFGIIMTLTRSVWFAIGVVGLAALLPRRWYVPLLLPPALAVAALPLITDLTERLGLNPHSSELRMQSISIGMQEFREQPFFGHGWAFTSAVGEFGLVGANGMSLYNLWIYLGVSVGIIGIAIFILFVLFLGREAANDSVAYLFLVGSLATSFSEMHLYACSLNGLLFFVLTSARAGNEILSPERPRTRAKWARTTVGNAFARGSPEALQKITSI